MCPRVSSHLNKLEEEIASQGIVQDLFPLAVQYAIELGVDRNNISRGIIVSNQVANEIMRRSGRRVEETDIYTIEQIASELEDERRSRHYSKTQQPPSPVIPGVW